MRVYIAGPMNGYPELNFPAFRSCAERLRAKGYEVLNPVEIGELHFPNDPDHKISPREYLIKDIMELLTCDAIALLPRWSASTGAMCEAVVAKTLGMTFMDSEGIMLDTPKELVCSGGYPR